MKPMKNKPGSRKPTERFRKPSLPDKKSPKLNSMPKPPALRPTVKSRPTAPDTSTRYRRSAYQGNRQMPRTSLAGRTPTRKISKKPEERPIFSGGKLDTAALKARAKKIAENALAGASVEKESIIKGTVIALLMIFFALLQTTVFTRLPPLGAVPDLMLSFTIAVAVSEGEKWGAVVSLFCALVISSLGAVGANELPLVYLTAAYLAGIMSHYYLRQNALIRLMYQVVAGFLRGAGTLIMLALVSPEYTLPQVMLGTIIPEYFSTLILAPFVHVITWLALLFFHRSRAQRTGEK